MMVTVTRKLIFVDCVIEPGVKGPVLSKNEAYKIDSQIERSAIIRARAMYDKRGLDGVFVLLRGKYRFVCKGDYK